MEGICRGGCMLMEGPGRICLDGESPRRATISEVFVNVLFGIFCKADLGGSLKMLHRPEVL